MASKSELILKLNILCVFLVITSICFGKSEHQDNLRFLTAAKTKQEKVEAYLKVIKGVVTKLPDTAIVYIKKLDELCSENDVELTKENQSKIKFYKGVYQYKKGYYLRAIKPIEESLNLAPNKLKGQKFFYLGLSHKLLGNYSQATEYFINAIKQYEEQGDKYAVLNIYINLGNVCGQIKKHDKALEYFGKALELAKETKKEKLNRIIYNNMGNAFLALEDYELALSQYTASYNDALKTKYKRGQFLTLINIAGAKRKLDRNKEALEHLTQALRLADSIGIPTLKGTIFWELGDFFTGLKNVGQAQLYLSKAYVIADTLKHYPNLKKIYSSYRDLYKSVGNYKKSLYYYEKYEEIKDFVSTRENELKVTQLYSEFEFEKKEQELAMLAQETKIEKQKNKLQQAELAAQIIKGERDSIFIYLLIGVGILLLVLAAGLGLITTIKHKKNGELKDMNLALEESQEEVESQNSELELVNKNLGEINEELVSKNSEIESQKSELQSQRDLLNLTNEQLKVRNKDVTDSIHYAQKIQQAMLYSSFQIEESGMEHFTFYKPRDIVSGDFYWGHKVNNQLIIAIGDCTGHGVPGAFMSCLGMSLLNEIVFGRKIIDPHVVLEDLRNSVIQLIATDRHADLQIGDGMDISIVVIDLETKNMKFSGAMNGVSIVRDGVMEELKGDKSPIGQHIIPNHTFTLQEYQLQAGDHIYMSTDGYKDQFGGPKGKKMGKRRVNESLTEFSHESIKVQYSNVISLYKNWKKFEEQIDDVCLFGMKIK